MIKTLVQSVGDRIKYGTKVRSTLYYGGSSIVCQVLRFLGVLISTAAIAPDQFWEICDGCHVARFVRFGGSVRTKLRFSELYTARPCLRAISLSDVVDA